MTDPSPTSVPVVRVATAADADAIAGVHVASWQAAYAGLLPAQPLAAVSVERRASLWRDVLSDATGWPAVHVAVIDDAVAGFVAVDRGREEGADPTLGELVGLYVEPVSWRRGIGRVLHDAALDRLSTAGFTNVMLWVLVGNERARRFYLSRGWSDDDAHKSETWGGVQLDQRRMSRTL
jgi:GNAT superfamily N-acetyltransferase